MTDMPISEPISREAILGWLDNWAACIRSGQFAEAALMFDKHVLGFGTVAIEAKGLDDLVQQQWMKVWPKTEGFRFDNASVETWGADGLAVAAVHWSSQGIDARSGALFSRHGRATLVLQRRGENLIAVHTHFSINPAGERFL